MRCRAMKLNTVPWPSLESVTAPVRPDKRAQRIKLYFILLALDVSWLVGSFVIGALLRFGEVLVDRWLGVTALLVALFVLTAVLRGAYSLEVLRSPSKGTARAVSSLGLAFALLFLLFYFLKVDQRISRMMTGSSFVIAMFGLVLVRQTAGDIIRRAQGGQFTTEMLLVDRVQPPPADGMIVVDASEVHLWPEPGNAAMQIRFADLLQGVDRIVVACSRQAAVKWAQLLKSTGRQGEVLTRDFDDLAPLGVSRLHDCSTLVVSTGSLNVRERMLKRSFDLALTVPALFLLLPVFVVVSIAIKLESRGPILFRQPRVGWGNRLFTIYKFRTMAADQTDLHGRVSGTRNDGRTTRIGRFLRRTSIDELPQLVNVLLGSMSLVGPRPHALGSLAGNQLFWHIDDRYWERHVLKPGITGLAQIRGLRGPTHTREHLTSRLGSDREYVSGWSIWRDIAILARTLRVLVHPDAY